mgnify:CR=1 FL=1
MSCDCLSRVFEKSQQEKVRREERKVDERREEDNNERTQEGKGKT